MLVLTRRVGEKILVGDSIEFAVLAIKGGQVRVGVRAPDNVSVDREEIAKRKQHDMRPRGARP